MFKKYEVEMNAPADLVAMEKVMAKIQLNKHKSAN
jgi:hypothetical protein